MNAESLETDRGNVLTRGYGYVALTRARRPQNSEVGGRTGIQELRPFAGLSKMGGMSKIWTMLTDVRIKSSGDFGAWGRLQEWTVLPQSFETYGRWGWRAQRGRTSVSASV